MNVSISMALLPPAYLIILWAWGLADYYINKHYNSKYQPALARPDPKFTPNDVSVVVRTLKPHWAFKACLIRWLENHPLEIIICTTEEYIEDVEQIVAEVVSGEVDGEKIKIEVSKKSCRGQLVTGILQAKGEIIVSSDNHIFWPRNFLINMLPCFENEKVGAACPEIMVYIPNSRQPRISPWEVAGTKMVERSLGFGTVMHTAAKWCWILTGCTGVYRAHILKDASFIECFLNESWNGVRLEIGDDTFITRWLLKHDWIIATQATEKTRVWRTVKATRALIPQMLRWERSSIVSFLHFVFNVPQTYSKFLIAFRAYERLLRAPLLLLHLVSWLFSIYLHPFIAFPLLAYYVYYKYLEYVKFFKKYPYMSKHWWAAVLLDFSPLFIGLEAWRTLSDNDWEMDEGGREIRW